MMPSSNNHNNNSNEPPPASGGYPTTGPGVPATRNLRASISDPTSVPSAAAATADPYLPVLLAEIPLRPKDISARFLRTHGSNLISWASVRDVTVAPFANSAGLSDAHLFHCVLTLKRDESCSSLRGSGVGVAPGASGGLGGSGSNAASSDDDGRKLPGPMMINDQQHHPPPPPGRAPAGDDTPITNSPASALAGRRYVFDSKSSSRTNSLDAQLNNNTNQRQQLPKTSSLANVANFFRRVMGSGGDDEAGALGQGLLERDLPPAVFLVKHYDTAEPDETKSLLIRWFRHVTRTTPDDMYRHELMFYLLVRPLLALHHGQFRTPQLLFATRVDRGRSTLLRYVCCRHGSGSMATIGLEDVSRVGYSFEHGRLHGLADVSVTLACVYSMAALHSAMWGRPATDPALAELDKAAILAGVHKVAPGISGRMDLTQMNLRSLVQAWQGYSTLLRLDAVIRAFADMQRRWPTVRQRAVELVQSNATLVHGDFHFRNLGFRRKVGGATHHQLHRPHPYRRDSRGGAAWAGVEDRGGTREKKGKWGAEEEEDEEEEEQLPVTDTEVCAVDFQHFGYGSPAAELLYFICTSLPVEIQQAARATAATLALLDTTSATSALEPTGGSHQQHSGDGGVGKQSGTSGGSPSGPAEHESVITSDSFGTMPVESSRQSISSGGLPSATLDGHVLVTSPMTDGGGGGGGGGGRSPAVASARPTLVPPALASGANHNPTATNNPSRSRSRYELPNMRCNEDFISFGTLDDVMQFDEAIQRAYFDALSMDARVSLGGFDAFQSQIYVLAENWAGSVLVDMEFSSVQERIQQKKRPGLSRLVDWGEKTSARLFVSLAARAQRTGAMGLGSGGSGGGGRHSPPGSSSGDLLARLFRRNRGGAGRSTSASTSTTPVVAGEAQPLLRSPP